MLHRFRNKLDHLRQQPEPVRLRVVAYLTAVSGIAISLLWITVLLPLQLRLNSPRSENQELPEQAILKEARNLDAPQVGGVQTTASPSPTPAL